MTEPRGGIARAAVLLSTLAALSAALGLVRDIVIAARFGAGSDLDAYLVAQGVMNLVLGLAAGAMAKASVPVVARGVAGGDVRGAHHSALVALGVTTVVLALGSLAMWLAAGPVVDVLAPGFAPGGARVARRLTRIVLIATVFIAGTNLLAAVAQSHRRFFWAGFQGIPFNLVMIFAAALFGPRYGITALAVGFVVGSAARCALQLLPLRAIGLRLRPSLDVRDRGFREIAGLLPALLLGSAIGNVNTLVDRAVGSSVGEGTISALNYGWRVAALAEMLLIVPLVTALYPAFGASRSPRELAGLVQRGSSTMAAVLSPVAVVLIVAATPIAAVVFGRGSFGREDVDQTAVALAWYAPAVVALGWREVTARAFYSVGDARTPVLVALGAMAINVVGDLTVGRRYGIAGLAASTTLSIALAAAAGTVLLARRHAAVAINDTVRSLARVVLAAGTAAIVAVVIATTLDLDVAQAGWVALLEVGVVASCVVTVYLAVLVALRGGELRVVVDAMPRFGRRTRAEDEETTTT